MSESTFIPVLTYGAEPLLSTDSVTALTQTLQSAKARNGVLTFQTTDPARTVQVQFNPAALCFMPDRVKQTYPANTPLKQVAQDLLKYAGTSENRYRWWRGEAARFALAHTDGDVITYDAGPVRFCYLWRTLHDYFAAHPFRAMRLTDGAHSYTVRELPEDATGTHCVYQVISSNQTVFLKTLPSVCQYIGNKAKNNGVPDCFFPVPTTTADPVLMRDPAPETLVHEIKTHFFRLPLTELCIETEWATVLLTPVLQEQTQAEPPFLLPNCVKTLIEVPAMRRSTFTHTASVSDILDAVLSAVRTCAS